MIVRAKNNDDISFGFFGSGHFAARCLEALLEWRAPAWIVTSPPKRAGRGRDMRPTPVESFAGNGALLNVPLVRSSSVSSDDDVLFLSRDIPVSFCFVIDFGQLIREPILSWNEPLGCLNIHPSLLPLYRGAAPVQRALMDRAPEIGVTIFKLAAAMDSGPILLREKILVRDDDDSGSLLARAARTGVRVFTEYLSDRPVSEWTFSPQDDSIATYADKISPEEERIDWAMPAFEICGKVRALSPRPGAWTMARGRRLKVLSASISEKSALNAPGELIGMGEGGVIAAAGDGCIILEKVQAEGKKLQAAMEWWNGLHASEGERLS
ncbi:MAG: methionyl-tRNA formyltransferase [Synergistaceae bacterium]|jgi:methionyl-tRNA formyltransferase|nr:methionyl-tRNA formyltransferase [Synergistaceae bacterium]